MRYENHWPHSIVRLKDVGCRFELDDFGSGLCPFGYLSTLPVDIVKIDGIFVKNITDNEIDRELVRSIDNMVYLMGKRTVAEFGESEESSAILLDMNVDFPQGYGIGKPHPIEQLLNGFSLRAR
ncbi:MAG: EAL domain-containing protein [Motiliproteus sp.]|nr:EAL domain-containing protein [Motiliproteus sp.]MCW9052545.1 EAL domain-containing protein [Motiliproteus sp.]